MGWTPRIIEGGGRPGDARPGGEPSDSELARAALAGLGPDGLPETPRPGQQAFGKLVERHQARVIALALHLTRNAEDARDVAQDAFLRAYRSLASFRQEMSFRSWLLKITVNAAHDHRSRARDHALRSVEEVPELAAREDLARRAESALLAERVRLATRELADREREVFVLRDLEGLEVEEVAAILGLAGPTVRRHLARARLRLRELLGRGR